MKKEIEFTLGADPEFCCSQSGEAVSARKVIKKGSDFGKLGADGNGMSFEIRPDPTPNPLELVANIRTILMASVFENPSLLNYSWDAGAYQLNYPLGGHIHFGLTQAQIHPKTACEVLSQYLGSIALAIEGTKQAILRRKSGDYGKYVDYRVQTWGFEWRTLSSWLVSPHVAAAVLCLAKTLVYELLNNKSFSPKYKFDETTFIQARVSEVLQSFDTLWNDITKMILYPKYKGHIDLLNYLVVNNKTWFPKNGMLASWGIHKIEAPEKISLESIWA